MYWNRTGGLAQAKLLIIVLALDPALQCLAQTPEPFEVRRAEVAFEELPEIKASEILKPELLKGPHYVIRDPRADRVGHEPVHDRFRLWCFRSGRKRNAASTTEGDRRDRATAGGF